MTWNKTIRNSGMSHWSVIRDLDYRQSKLLASPYHRRSHKNEEMSQLFEKDLSFPNELFCPLASEKRAPFSQLSLSSRRDVSIYSLYLRGMEGHHSIRKQLRATDTFIAPKRQTRERYSFNSTRYLACQYLPCEKLLVTTQLLSSAWT